MADIKPVSTADILAMPRREFFLLIGKDGAGKSCAIVSMASWVQVLWPEATFWVIDSENKFATALKSFAGDAPTNIQMLQVEDMNGVTDAWAYVNAKRKAGDWLAVESMSRIWERTQDMAYLATSGFDKAGYLEKRKEWLEANPGKKSQAPIVIPKPDQFWSIAKGAHDGAFLDPISQASSLNVVLSAFVGKPPKENASSPIKENVDRKEARIEYGLDAGIEGAPRLPSYVQTTCMFTVRDGKVKCRVLRDDNTRLESPRIEFDVESRKAFGMRFWTECRDF